MIEKQDWFSNPPVSPMRVLNFKRLKFNSGDKVVMISDYKSGSIHLRVGDIGTVDKITFEDFPDFGWYNLRIVYVKFKNNIHFGMTQAIAEMHMDII